MCPRIDRVCSLQTGLFVRLQSDFDGTCNRLGDLVLQSQKVTQVTLVTVSPKLLIVARMDKPGADLHAVSDALDRAFHDGVHLQRLGDLRQGFVCVLEAHDGGS